MMVINKYNYNNKVEYTYNDNYKWLHNDYIIKDGDSGQSNKGSASSCNHGKRSRNVD